MAGPAQEVVKSLLIIVTEPILYMFVTSVRIRIEYCDASMDQQEGSGDQQTRLSVLLNEEEEHHETVKRQEVDLCPKLNLAV